MHAQRLLLPEEKTRFRVLSSAPCQNPVRHLPCKSGPHRLVPDVSQIGHRTLCRHLPREQSLIVRHGKGKRRHARCAELIQGRSRRRDRKITGGKQIRHPLHAGISRSQKRQFTPRKQAFFLLHGTAVFCISSPYQGVCPLSAQNLTEPFRHPEGICSAGGYQNFPHGWPHLRLPVHELLPKRRILRSQKPPAGCMIELFQILRIRIIVDQKIHLRIEGSLIVDTGKERAAGSLPCNLLSLPGRPIRRCRSRLPLR